MSDFHTEAKIDAGVLLVSILQKVPLTITGGFSGVVAQLAFSPHSRNIAVSITELCYVNPICFNLFQSALREFGLAAGIGLIAGFAISKIVMDGHNSGSYVGNTDTTWIDTDSDLNLN